ncbi:MAG: bifunctional phosphopantothenoylcysteine decarboxylase/phosphopantothenate--cysteine ligase CoaBC [Campylobacterales bacterium]
MLVDLRGRSVIVGVSGSIAAYKSLELIRLFIKSNALVQVVMSESAKKFVTPLSLEALSQNKVLCSKTESWDENGLNHISLKDRGEIFILAPASVNTINKLSCGVCDTLLLQSLVAFGKKTLLAPAANSAMLEFESTKESLKKLQDMNISIIPPKESLLACQEVGNGALAEPLEIYYQACRELLKTEFWSDKGVVVSGGGSSEMIDPIRSITNASSGKMASSIALILYLRGANVSFVTSKLPYTMPKNIELVLYESSDELKKELEIRSDKDYLFMVAAVADFIPKKVDGKIKKDNIDTLNLVLEKNSDILKELNFKGKKIGFKAESDKKNGLNSAKMMLEKKSLDAVCLNYIDDEYGFGSDKQSMSFVNKDGVYNLGSASKLELAEMIVMKVESC